MGYYFNKVSPKLIYELFTDGYLNFLYPSLSVIELEKFLKSIKKANKDFSIGYVYLRFFSISLEKDEDKGYEAIHFVEISNITPKTTIQVDKNKCFKTPTFDKSWINYKRSTDALGIKCQSQRLIERRKNTIV